jgi:hypothetical protein
MFDVRDQLTIEEALRHYGLAYNHEATPVLYPGQPLGVVSYESVGSMSPSPHSVVTAAPPASGRILR